MWKSVDRNQISKCLKTTWKKTPLLTLYFVLSKMEKLNTLNNENESYYYFVILYLCSPIFCLDNIIESVLKTHNQFLP